jgi:D-alanine-D-alanine ligase
MSLRIGLTYNLRTDHPQYDDGPADIVADWDLSEPMAGIAAGLARMGYDVVDIGDPRRLLDADFGLDLVFNAAEMTGLRYREALAPALYELLGIPYTLSTPDAMVVSLDKNLSNLVVRQAGGRVPDWVVAGGADDPALSTLATNGARSRWIVKPVAEGASAGVLRGSVCDTVEQVRQRVQWSVDTYAEPALVQRFMSGRELTVGVVDVDGEPRALAPVEVDLSGTGDVPLFHWESKESLGDDAVPCAVVGPDDPIYEPAQRLAVLSYRAVGARDCARVDLRCAEGSRDLAFLEINTVPGLDPDSAEAFAMDYDELLGVIVASAARRLPAAAGSTGSSRLSSSSTNVR